MNKQKLSLTEIKVESFTTSLNTNEKLTINGGGRNSNMAECYTHGRFKCEQTLEGTQNHEACTQNGCSYGCTEQVTVCYSLNC